MIRCLLRMFFSIIIIFSTNTLANASPNWLTISEGADAAYQVDQEKVIFSGEAPNRQLDMWMKTTYKTSLAATPNPIGSYMLSHYLVKEGSLTFILMERNMYLPEGELHDEFQNHTDKWHTTTEKSPIGFVAKRIFNDYGKDLPMDNNNKNDTPEIGKPVVDSPKVTLDPKELKKALDDDRIKHGIDKNEKKWFYVQDTDTIWHFLDSEHMTADFWLLDSPKRGKSYRLNFSFNDSRPGRHSIKESITVVVDNKAWVLSEPLASDGTSFPNAIFNYSFNIPNSLIQALLVTKSGVTIKWRHSLGEWKDYEYTIPEKKVHDIQLMYLGA